MTRSRLAARFPLIASAFAVLVGLPYLLAGPGAILDDWFTLRWQWMDGSLRAAGPTQWRARPLGAVVYTVQFELIGNHPLVWAIIQLAITAATAGLGHLLLRRLLGDRRALAVVGVWVLAANHTTLDHWGSGSLAGISLLLVVGGGLLVVRSVEAERDVSLGTVVLALAPLVYEATLPAALALAIALPWLLGRRTGALAALQRASPILAAGCWVILGSYHLRHDQGWFGFASIVDALFGRGVVRWTGPAKVLGLVGLVAVALAIAGRFSALAETIVPRPSACLIEAGLVVIVVGYAAFLRYPINPLGLGDRANVVSAIGGAMIWVGLFETLWRHRIVGPVAVVGVLALFGGARVARALDWSNAGRDAQAMLAVTAERVRQDPSQTYVLGPRAISHQGIIPSIGTMEPGLQTYLRNPAAHALVAIRPAQYAQAPPAARIDLTTLPGRR